MNPQTYAVTAVGTSTLIVAGATLAKGRTPNVRVFIGGTIAAFMLSAAAGPFPGAVRALAHLIILGTLLGAGYSLAQPLARLVRGTD